MQAKYLSINSKRQFIMLIWLHEYPFLKQNTTQPRFYDEHIEKTNFFLILV